MVRYNSPPNWPPPPTDWTPPPGWQPDPAWGPAPPGWLFWVEDTSAGTHDQRAPVSGQFLPVKPRNNTVRNVLLAIGGAFLLLFLVIVVIGVAGRGGNEAATSDGAQGPLPPGAGTAPPATRTPTPVVTPTPTPVAPPAADGSRSRPFAIGTPVSNQEWEVTLGQPRDGTAEVLAENMFNDAPAEGMQYWIVPMTIQYIGQESGLPWIEITLKFVGADARTYSDDCGVIPNDVFQIDELYPGGVVDANDCVAVPAGADGLWTLQAGWLGDTVFFTAAADAS